MANYPDWLMKYKTKGIYVKRLKDGYALYRGHSERVEGKAYPAFKCDEYLGRVTEHDGLIPSAPPVKPGIIVLRYGLCCVAEQICAILRRTPRRNGFDASLIYVHGLLSFEGRRDADGFAGSYLREMYPGVDFGRALTEDEEKAVDRIARQIRSKFQLKFRDDCDALLSAAANLYAVRVNERWHASNMPPMLETLAEKYRLKISTDI